RGVRNEKGTSSLSTLNGPLALPLASSGSTPTTRATSAEEECSGVNPCQLLLGSAALAEVKLPDAASSSTRSAASSAAAKKGTTNINIKNKLTVFLMRLPLNGNVRHELRATDHHTRTASPRPDWTRRRGEDGP